MSSVMRLSQNVFFNIAGHAVLIVGTAHGEAQRLHVVAGITHGDAGACCLQHGDIVEAVTKGKQFVHREAEIITAPAQGVALGGLQRIALQEIRLGAGQGRTSGKDRLCLLVQLSDTLRRVHHQQFGDGPLDEGGQVAHVIALQRGGIGVGNRVFVFDAVKETVGGVGLTVYAALRGEAGDLVGQINGEKLLHEQGTVSAGQWGRAGRNGTKSPHIRAVAGDECRGASDALHGWVHAVPCAPGSGEDHDALLRCTGQNVNRVVGYGHVRAQERVVQVKGDGANGHVSLSDQ